jgi:hypothetical protein
MEKRKITQLHYGFSNNDNVYYANFGPTSGIQGVRIEKEA